MRIAFLAAAVFAAAIATFFAWYTLRLMYVTRFLTVAPNSGAYIGAVVFPLLAFALGFVTRWSWRRSKARPRWAGSPPGRHGE